MVLDRQCWRALIVLIGLFCSTVSNGCLRSSFVRSGSAPDPASASSAIAGPADRASALPSPAPEISSTSPSSPEATAVQTAGLLIPPPRSATAPSQQTLSAAPMELEGAPVAHDSAPQSTGTRDVNESDAALGAAPPASKGTPMLDAAIRRVAAVTDQQRESLAADPVPAAPYKEKPLQVTHPVPAVGSAGSKPPIPEAPTVASPPRSSSEPSQGKGKSPEPPLAVSILVDPPSRTLPAARSSSPDPALAQSPVPAAAPAGSVPEPVLKEGARKPGDLADERTPQSSAQPQTPDQTSDASRSIPLEVNELRLCRSVMGFGSFETTEQKDPEGGRAPPDLLRVDRPGIRSEGGRLRVADLIPDRAQARGWWTGPVGTGTGFRARFMPPSPARLLRELYRRSAAVSVAGLLPASAGPD